MNIIAVNGKCAISNTIKQTFLLVLPFGLIIPTINKIKDITNKLPIKKSSIVCPPVIYTKIY